jgi:hypothetical protein
MPDEMMLRATHRNGREIMEWLNRKTSIAGTQVPNWLVVLGAIVIVVIVYEMVPH